MFIKLDEHTIVNADQITMLKFVPDWVEPWFAADKSPEPTAALLLSLAGDHNSEVAYTLRYLGDEALDLWEVLKGTLL